MQWFFNEQTQMLFELKAALSLGIGAQLHLVVFSQLPPCDSCMGFFDRFLKVMETEMTAVLQSPILPSPNITKPTLGITLDVYGSVRSKNDYPNPILYPGSVNTPSDVEDYYHNDIYIRPVP